MCLGVGGPVEPVFAAQPAIVVPELEKNLAAIESKPAMDSNYSPFDNHPKGTQNSFSPSSNRDPRPNFTQSFSGAKLSIPKFEPEPPGTHFIRDRDTLADGKPDLLLDDLSDPSDFVARLT